MSSTSGSCTQWPSGFVFDTTNFAVSKSTVPSAAVSYQAGIWWPHQSWRLMHQSWMFRIHAK